MIGERRLRFAFPACDTRAGIVDRMRTVVTAIVGVAVTILAGAAIIGIAIVRPDAPVVDRIVKLWARLVLAVAGVRVETHYTAELDANQAYVVIANHRSLFDIMCLFVALPMPIRFLAKRELFSIPGFGILLRSLRMVSINRVSADHTTINAASGAALESGLSLVVFAEGTRVYATDSRPFKKGGFIIAQQHSAPILPVSLIGSGNILPPHGKVVNSGRVAVVVAEAVQPAVVASKPVDELMEETRAVVLGNEEQWPSE